jgi:hypothetical protein
MASRRDILQAAAAFGLAGVLAAGSPSGLRAQEAMVLRQGTFTGASGHATAGSGAIVEQNGRYYVSLGRDFDHDDTAPDAKVAMGRDGYRAETLMGPLKAAKGAQSYLVPAGVDQADYNEIWIWCERFSVPLGVARLR